MTKPQKDRILKVLSAIQDARRALDKEAAKGLSGVSEFGVSIQLDDAIWGLVYAERAIAMAFDKEDWLAGLTNEQRERYGFKREK